MTLLSRLATGLALAVTLMLATAAGAQTPSTSFRMTGMVENHTRYTLKSLEALPSVSETVTYYTMAGAVTGTFVGVPLWTLLTDASIETDPTVKNDILRAVVVVTGSDGYKAAFSAGELDPSFGNEPVIVAYSFNGQPISPGFAQIVVPNDTYGGRYVNLISSIQTLIAK